MIKYVLFALGLFVTPLCAQTVYFNPVLNTLVNGTTGLSAQVNANYNKIIADGNAANTTLLANIAALGPKGFPTGAVVMFNQATCPTGFSRTNGSTASLDTRGTYIRGLDNGAGRDVNRVLASYQADQIQNHFHIAPAANATPSQIALLLASPSSFHATQLIFSAPSTTNTMVVPGLSETRPASVVLLHCTNLGVGTGITPFSPPPQILSNLIVPDANIMMADYNRIISDGNTAFNAIQAAITAAGGASFNAPPAGAVVPFNLAVCPTGWVKSDGTGGTVDMRGRFARVTTGNPAVGTIQADQFLDHTHSIIAKFTTSVGGNTGTVFGTLSPGTLFFIDTLSPITILDVVNANVGTETRPKNVALLFCQKS